MHFKLLAALSLAAVVLAQGSSSASGTASAPLPSISISPCILQCSTQAAAATSCGDITNLQCICTNTDFQTAAGTCIATTCPDEAAAALTIQQEECAAITGSAAPSGTATTPAGTGTAATPTGTGSSPAASTTKPASSSAAAPAATTSKASAGVAAHVDSVLAIAGALLGGALAL